MSSLSRKVRRSLEQAGKRHKKHSVLSKYNEKLYKIAKKRKDTHYLELHPTKGYRINKL